MGYTTEFSGQFTITPALMPEHLAYLKAFADTRRMKRDPVKAVHLPDPIRDATDLPVGFDGQYFTGGTGYKGQIVDASVVSGNYPPATQPGLWCQWVPTEDGAFLEWDGDEKFYNYIEWLEYLINHFFLRWGYSLNGSVKWRGDVFDDIGVINVSNNVVSVKEGTYNA